MIRGSLLALALSGALASGATAQADTTRRDTTAATTRRDSTQRDTTQRDTTPALLPPFPPAIATGPLPLGSRYTFTRDSMLFTNARTLSDLLSHVPGVYVARGGWYGQAEIVLYGGRGPAGVEIYWDGVPYAPLGRDSIYIDPARIPLAPLERVDVVVLPAALRVYLVTARARSSGAGTQIGILTGEQDIAGYRAGYAKRARAGFGIALLADWSSIGVGPVGTTTTPFGTSDLSLKLEYVPPDARIGASFEIASSSWHRAADLDVDGWRQDRRDRTLRLFVAERDDGLGYRLNATLATSAISHDTAIAPRSVSTAVLEASNTWRDANVTATARFGAGGLPQQFEARAGWRPRPIPFLTAAGTVRHSSYSGRRTGDRAYVTAGITLPLGFSARAEGAWQRDVQSVFVTADPLQEASDVAGWVRFDHPRLMVEVGRGRRDAFTPLGFAAGIKTVRSLHSTPVTEFVAGHASLRMLPGFTLSGWYFDPVIGGGDFEPPHHARVSATFQSKFWRVFKSGIFALRAEVAMESWSRWALGGMDTAGVQRTIPGASFVDTNLEMQLAGVTIFWYIQNMNLMRASYVEGLSYPKSAQQYGARWFFTN